MTPESALTLLIQVLKIAGSSAVLIAWLRYRYKLLAPGAYVDAMNRAQGKAQRDAAVKLFCAANPGAKSKDRRQIRLTKPSD